MPRRRNKKRSDSLAATMGRIQLQSSASIPTEVLELIFQSMVPSYEEKIQHENDRYPEQLIQIERDYKRDCRAVRQVCHRFSQLRAINAALFHTFFLYPHTFSLRSLRELADDEMLRGYVKRIVFMQPQFEPRFVDYHTYESLLRYFHDEFQRAATSRRPNTGPDNCHPLVNTYQGNWPSAKSLKAAHATYLQGLRDQQNILLGGHYLAVRAASLPKFPNIRTAIISDGNGSAPAYWRHGHGYDHKSLLERRYPKVALAEVARGYPLEIWTNYRSYDGWNDDDSDSNVAEADKSSIVKAQIRKQIASKRSQSPTAPQVADAVAENEPWAISIWDEGDGDIFRVDLGAHLFSRLVLTVLGVGATKVTSLDFAHGRTITPDTDFRSTLANACFRTALPLQTLRVILGGSTPESRWTDEKEDRAVFPLLKHASSTLRSLHFKTEDEDRDLRGIMYRVLDLGGEYPHLREFKFNVQEADSWSLAQFLKKQPLIRKLHGKGLTGYKVEWRELLECLHKSETLVDIQLLGLMETDEGEHGDDEWTGKWMVFIPVERWVAVRNGQEETWSRQSLVSLWDYVHGKGDWDDALARVFGNFGDN